MDFTKFVENLEDTRRRQGLRHSFKPMLVMILLGVCSGHHSRRGLWRFMGANATFFTKELCLKSGIPSHVTVTKMLNNLDKSQTVQAFNKWTLQEKILKKGDRVSMDGKALRSTVQNEQTSSQDFVNIVSIYAKELGLVAFVEDYKNKKSNEIHVVQGMLEYLRDQQVVVLLDALHCQKKQQN